MIATLKYGHSIMTIWQKLLPQWADFFIKHPRQALPEIHTGFIMAILVIPQSLGYATLAGLPPVMGLYSAIVPTLVYAYLGASSVNAVGPVAVTAIMTGGALSAYSLGSVQYIQMAITLAMMVGVLLLMASYLRLGWIMQFVSRGVCTGFISGAAVLIILSQLKHLLGLPIIGDSIISIISNLKGVENWVNLPTALVGGMSFILLMINRYQPRVFWGLFAEKYQVLGKRFFIILYVFLGTWLVWALGLDNLGVRTLNTLPTHFPTPSLPILRPAVLMELLPSALLIGLISFICSAAIADNFARLRQEPFDNNQELKGLGLANIASGLFGGFVVAGGVSRTSLNVSIGANSPLSSMVCPLGVLVILVFFGQYLAHLPYALLAAIITSSVISMIDVHTFKSAWQHDKAEALSFAITFLGCIIFGLNAGLVAGLLVSFAGLIYRSHHAYVAVLGQVGTSDHFRNILRHKATTFDNLVLIRIDESLYFGNIATIKHKIEQILMQYPNAYDVVLVMTAVNHIDLSAQEMLSTLNKTLTQHGKRLHFSEIKGPMMDILKKTDILTNLSGQAFLSTALAVNALKKQPTLTQNH